MGSTLTDITDEMTDAGIVAYYQSRWAAEDGRSLLSPLDLRVRMAATLLVDKYGWEPSRAVSSSLAVVAAGDAVPQDAA